MERFKKVLNPLVILLGVIIILIVKLEQSKQETFEINGKKVNVNPDVVGGTAQSKTERCIAQKKS